MYHQKYSTGLAVILSNFYTHLLKLRLVLRFLLLNGLQCSCYKMRFCSFSFTILFQSERSTVKLIFAAVGTAEETPTHSLYFPSSPPKTKR